jgi:hypothetical protein
MKPPETNDSLDALLRENDAYLEDGGFTARVVAALPPRRRSWLRPVILLGATVIGFALIAWWLPPLSKLSDVFVRDQQGSILLELSAQSILLAGVLALVAASLFWSLFAVIKWED